MNVEKCRIRERMLDKFLLSHIAAEAAQNISQTFDKNRISESACRRCFAKFRNGDENVKDKSRSGAPTRIDKKYRARSR